MDTKTEFINAINIGREIEFSCNGIAYFESRKGDTQWYIFNESDKSFQYFISAEELLEEAIIEGERLKYMWEKIQIDYIL